MRLQVFLAFNIFLIGALTTIAIQHAYAHFKPHHDDEKDGEKKSHVRQEVSLSPEARERLLEKSQAQFEAVLNHSAEDLEHDLEKTGSELNRVLQKIGANIVGTEMERYRLQLDQIRKDAAVAIGNAQDEMSKHQAELKAALKDEQTEVRAKLAEEIAAEKQRVVQEILAEKQQIIKQIDTKLADAVASFLLETLGHNVDLGAQMAYLTSMLEEHKADFIAQVIAESPAEVPTRENPNAA